MNNKRKKKLLFLLIWFLLTSSLLATGSYAWFSSNRITEIEFFNVHVETDGGVQISADAISWRTVLNLRELIDVSETYPTSVNQIPSQMRPVSTGGTIDTATGFLRMFYGNVENDTDNNLLLSASRDIEERGNGIDSNGNFIAFDVFFKTTGSKELYLSSQSYVDPDDEETVGIENSARVAFVVEGNATNNTNINTIQNLKNATVNDVYIWEPNYDIHTQSGVDSAYNVYGIETTLTNGNQILYDGVNSDIPSNLSLRVEEATSIMNPTLFRRPNISILSRKDFTDNKLMFTLEEGITKVRIYMWLEGQDVDSENNASFGNINYFLQFTLNP